jgi:hypothetical protein
MHVSNRIIVRNEMGQFIRDVEGAATETVKEAIEEGAALSRGFAPVGRKPDPRTGKIIDSFFTPVLSRTSGVWGNRARHALYQEKGTAPHEITGDVTFFWEKYWRMWEPGDNMIQHPGNPAHPFLAPAYRIVSRKLLDIAKRHYPG